jgi:aldehyde dehydrogenase (NAD+)
MLSHYVNNKLYKSAPGDLIKYSPLNEKILYKCSHASEDLIHMAFESSRNAMTHWWQLPIFQRAKYIELIGENVFALRKEIAKLISTDTGKNIEMALQEVDAVVGYSKYVSNLAKLSNGQLFSSSVEREYLVVREPIGLALLITPFNTPLASIAWKLFPCMLMGNVSILKPSELCFSVINIFLQIIKKINLPSGVINLLLGDGSKTVKKIIEIGKIDLISFTGSTQAGVMVNNLLSGKMIRKSFELGGNNPIIVFKDADLDIATNCIIDSCLSYAGQRCVSATNIFVEKEIYNKIRNGILRKFKTINLKDFVGPIVTKDRLGEFCAKTTISSKEIKLSKAKVNLPSKGYYASPTLLESVNNNFYFSDPVYGPVIVLSFFEDMDDVIKKCNDLESRLSVAVHSNNSKNMRDCSFLLDFGVVICNGNTFGSEAHVPFGGRGASGNFSREPGLAALDLYSTSKNIVF